MRPVLLLLVALAPGWSQLKNVTAPAPEAPIRAVTINPNKATPIALGTFTGLEKRFDGTLANLSPNDPVDLLGTTRGVYLAGYGAVFTTELSLVISPALSPFTQQITPAMIDGVYQRKIQRLPTLKKAMLDMMKNAAFTLAQIPETQQIVLAVRLDYLPWEKTVNLPGLILMKADRRSALNGIVTTEEQ